MAKIKKFANCIIKNYNFSSHAKTGFSCYIPDSMQHSEYGFIIWVYSETHKRLETHFQNLFSSNRKIAIRQFNKLETEYGNEMYDSVSKFITELNQIAGFHKIGNGIINRPSNRPKLYNQAILFDLIEKDYQILKEIEIVFTNNSLIDYICTLKQNRNIPLKRICTSCYAKLFEK